MISHKSERAEAVKAEQWARIKALRAQFEKRPIVTRWGEFQFDDSSRRRIRDVVEAIGTAWVGWVDAHNQRIEFSPSDFSHLYYELVRLSGVRVLELGEFTQRLREQLPLPADHPALRGEGWP